MSGTPSLRPACADECVKVLQEQAKGLGLDLTVSWQRPPFDCGYEPLGMRCPHGVLWFAEPTNEQIAAYIRDGVA